MSDTIEDLKEAEKESLHFEETPRQVQRDKGSTTWGLVLIGLGIFFLVTRVGGFFIQNWWALFILIPSFHNLNEAWQSYQANGRLTQHARHSLMGGLLIGMVAVFFLFNVGWNLFWPLVLILLGIGALLNGRS
ncbi:MAG: hypothetical protein KC445_20410 [Anaerolineales bacterium]|nr:hypothetical protein [Anaerolineales bacterium]